MNKFHSTVFLIYRQFKRVASLDVIAILKDTQLAKKLCEFFYQEFSIFGKEKLFSIEKVDILKFNR